MSRTAGIAELLDRVRVDVHDVEPKRVPARGLGPARAGEAAVAQLEDPGAHLGLVRAPPVRYRVEVGQVVDGQLGDGIIERRRVGPIETLAPAPFDVELMDEGRAEVANSDWCQFDEGGWRVMRCLEDGSWTKYMWSRSRPTSSARIAEILRWAAGAR